METDDRTPFDDFLEELQRWEAGERGENDQPEDEQPLPPTRNALVFTLVCSGEVVAGLCEDLISRYAPAAPREKMVEDLQVWLDAHIRDAADSNLARDPTWTEQDYESFHRLLYLYQRIVECNIHVALGIGIAE